MVKRADSINRGTRRQYSPAYDGLFIAMCFYRLQQVKEAQRWLEDARSRIKRHHAEEADMLALLREAEGLIADR